MPFPETTIKDSLKELIDEGVMKMEGDNLYQKRMVKDGELSIIRSGIGKKGGSTVTKQYGKPGFLYLMSDHASSHKIGISVNPQNRLYRLRSDLNLPKHFEIIESVRVDDMGTSEDNAHKFFGDSMDGEWVIGKYEDVLSNFALLKPKIKPKVKAKPQANTENESEYEFETDNVIVIGEKKEIHISISKKYTTDKAYIIYNLQEYFEMQQQLSAITSNGWTKFDLFMADNPAKVFEDPNHLYNSFKLFHTQTENNGTRTGSKSANPKTSTRFSGTGYSEGL